MTPDIRAMAKEIVCRWFGPGVHVNKSMGDAIESLCRKVREEGKQEGRNEGLDEAAELCKNDPKGHYRIKEGLAKLILSLKSSNERSSK